MFIKILKANAQFKTVGEIVDADDAKAQFLIDEGFAEKTETPTTIKAVDTDMAGLVELLGTKIADNAIGKIKTAVAPSGKRLSHTDEPTEAFVLPSEVKRHGSLKNFSNDEKGIEQAYRFGMYLLANYAGNTYDPERRAAMAPYREKCRKLGISLKKVMLSEDGEPVMSVTKSVGGDIVDTKAASTEQNNVSSGYLVPDEFQNTLIDLREKFGVFRRNAKILPMASDTRSDPRRRGGATANFVGESQAGTQTNKNWDRVRLTAKKLMFLAKYSNELNEDAVLQIADDLAGEAAYAFAQKEDDCGFNGTASSTYGGITGVCTALTNLSGTIANILGLTVSTGTGYATNYNSIVLKDFNKVVGTLPEFADTPNAKWFMSRTFWGSVVQALATAGGGNAVSNIQMGAREKMFLGYPVEISQVLPKTSATSQVCALFGDLTLAAKLGNRRDFTLSLSDAALNAFEQDEMALRATERFDIVVHDVGEITGGTARDTVMGLTAGPIVGLITAAS